MRYFRLFAQLDCLGSLLDSFPHGLFMRCFFRTVMNRNHPVLGRIIQIRERYGNVGKYCFSPHLAKLV